MEEYAGHLKTAIMGLRATTIIDWAPIALSAVAIIIAIYIPSVIAKKQNKIAIFEKLFDSYSQLKLVNSFALLTKDYRFDKDPSETQRQRALTYINFESSFDCKLNIDDYANSIGLALATLRRSEIKAHMLPLLISKKVKSMEDCNNKITAIYDELFCFISDLILFNQRKAREVDESLLKFVSASEEFFESYSDVVEKELQL